MLRLSPQLLFYHATRVLPAPSSAVVPGFRPLLNNIEGIFSNSSSHFEKTDYFWII